MKDKQIVCTVIDEGALNIRIGRKEGIGFYVTFNSLGHIAMR